MIYDKIENIGRYKGCSLWLNEAIAFLEKTDLKSLPCGRTDINGDYVFANVMEAKAKEAEEGKFEIHRKYMDIQIDIEGTEIIQIGLDSRGELDAYNPQTDFGTVVCYCSASCVMGPGRFIICMGEEPHMPGIKSGADRHLRKCVVKVAVP